MGKLLGKPGAFLLILLFFLVSTISCGDQRDSNGLSDKVNQLTERVSELSKQVEMLSEQVNALLEKPLTPVAEKQLKAGFVYVGPVGDYGWSHAHDVAISADELIVTTTACTFDAETDVPTS